MEGMLGERRLHGRRKKSGKRLATLDTLDKAIYVQLCRGSVVLYMLSYCSMDKHTFPLLYGNGVTHDSWKCWESMSRSELRCLSSALI